MKIVRDLSQEERNALKDRYRCQQNFTTHWKSVLDKPHCFVANVFPEDFRHILIYSVISDITQYAERQPLSEVIAYVKTHPEYLSGLGTGWLYGKRVWHYLSKLRACETEMLHCFIRLGDCFMLDKGQAPNEMQNEITDGMHRLVAYGIASEMDEFYFPVPIYFGTDKSLSIVESG